MRVRQPKEKLMRHKTLVARIFENKQFESQARSQGLADLAKLSGVEGYTARDMTAEHAGQIEYMPWGTLFVKVDGLWHVLYLSSILGRQVSKTNPKSTIIHSLTTFSHHVARRSA